MSTPSNASSPPPERRGAAGGSDAPRASEATGACGAADAQERSAAADGERWLPRLLPLLALGSLPRTGWVLAGVPAPESIAAHSSGVAQLVLVLGEGVRPALALERAVALAVVHDLAEARTGDLPRRAAQALPPGAKAGMEEAAARELLEGHAPRALALWREQAAGASREARFVKLCDRLQLGLRLVGYARAGVRGLGEFRAVVEELDCSGFAPCASLRAELMAELDALGLRGP